MSAPHLREFVSIPSTQRTFVKNFMGRSITVLETADLFREGNKQVPSSTIDVVQTETLAPQVLRGKRIFYNASGSANERRGLHELRDLSPGW